MTPHSHSDKVPVKVVIEKYGLSQQIIFEMAAKGEIHLWAFIAEIDGNLNSIPADIEQNADDIPQNFYDEMESYNGNLPTIYRWLRVRTEDIFWCVLHGKPKLPNGAKLYDENNLEVGTPREYIRDEDISLRLENLFVSSNEVYLKTPDDKNTSANHRDETIQINKNALEVIFKGERLACTPNQIKCVQILARIHKEYKENAKNSPFICEKDLLEMAELTSRRLKDQFRGKTHNDTFKKIFKRSRQKQPALYCLNV